MTDIAPKEKVITVIETKRGYGFAVFSGTYTGPVTSADLHTKLRGSMGGEVEKFANGVFRYKAFFD